MRRRAEPGSPPKRLASSQTVCWASAPQLPRQIHEYLFIHSADVDRSCGRPRTGPVQHWCDDDAEHAVSESYTVTADGDLDDDVEMLFRPRLCELRSWPDFDGYGFDLHVNDENDVKYIGKIDPGSPAEAAGKSSVSRPFVISCASGRSAADYVMQMCAGSFLHPSGGITPNFRTTPPPGFVSWYPPVAILGGRLHIRGLPGLTPTLRSTPLSCHVLENSLNVCMCVCVCVCACASVCVSFCLSVYAVISCGQNISTSYERILMKFLHCWWSVAQGPIDFHTQIRCNRVEMPCDRTIQHTLPQSLQDYHHS